MSGKRRENILHQTCAEASEKHNAKCYEVEVVITGRVLSRSRVVVREREELIGT